MKFLMKIIFFVFLITSIVGLVYLLIDLSNNKDIVTVYNKVGSSKSVNINGMKKLNFLSTYVKETGEYGVAIMKGYDDASLTDYEDEQENEEEPEEGTGNTGSGEVVFASSMTKEGWQEALTKKNHPYFTTGAGYRIYEINGKAYLREVQNSTYYGDCKNGYDWVYNDKGEITNSSIGGVGCFMYSVVNATNNLLGSTYSVESLVPFFVTDSGTTDGWSNKVVWDSSTNKWKNEVRDPNGNIVNKPLRLNVAGNTNNIRAATIFMNNNNLSVENMNTAGTMKSVYDKLINWGFDNCVYILYCHTEGTSHNGCHWQVCVGVGNNSLYIIDNEQNGSPTELKDEITKFPFNIPLNGSLNSGCGEEVTVVLKITKL